jgi:hypothetical protein
MHIVHITTIKYLQLIAYLLNIIIKNDDNNAGGDEMNLYKTEYYKIMK